MTRCLCDFRHIRPRFELTQEQTLRWIAQAHGKATQDSQQGQQLHERLMALGLASTQMGRRATQLEDYTHEKWDQMETYPVTQRPQGVGFGERSRQYDRYASQIFEQFYPEGEPLPAHLIHVTCTGYVCPSPAQRLVALRRAGERVAVTHAYHMGCYGSIPAIRIAGSEADLVHTELCSLHVHPLRTNSEQLVAQGLFADGFIRYSVRRHCHGPHLKVLALLQETIPDSIEAMSWNCDDHGLVMTLSKQVPVLIARALPGYLERLCEGADWQQAYFAVHPGGPKILNLIRDRLNLTPAQIAASEGVLHDYGNMSSATLPHIWERMLHDPTVPDGTTIVSLAFGPGLTIAGGLFEKCS
jgi:predicted naringenin-chalcone synthase